jgi:hypothetical protein
LGHLGTGATGFERCTANPTGLIVPSAASAGAARLDEGQMGHIGQQSPCKYYELTPTGKKQLEVETDSWRKLTAAVTQILESA